MKRTIILGGFVLLLHNIFTVAKKFKIDEVEVQVWEVYKVPSQSEKDPQELYLLKKLNVLDEESIPFQTHKTFILLKILHIQWFISYWLGKETTIKQKLETAALTGELWHQIVTTPRTDLILKLETKPIDKGLYYDIYINQQSCTLTPMTNAKEKRPMNYEYVNLPSNDRVIPNITRETENNESDLFKIFFGKYAGKLLQRTEKLQVPDLYEINLENEEEICINLVPLDIEKKEKNSYVLDEGNVISDSGESDIKETLVHNLIYEKLPNNIKIKLMKYHSIESRIKYLKRVDQKSKPYTGESSSAENTTASKEKKKKILFKVNSFKKTGETEESIYVDLHPLNVNSISEDTCYILENKIVNNFYIYIGTECRLNIIKLALEIMEKVNETQNFKKVIFAVNTGRKEPVAFWVNFEDYTEFIISSSIPLNNFSHRLMSSIGDIPFQD